MLWLKASCCTRLCSTMTVFHNLMDRFILGHTPDYIQRRPANISSNVPWPNPNQIVGALRDMATQNWPPYVSPLLHPNAKRPLPSGIDSIIYSNHLKSTSCHTKSLLRIATSTAAVMLRSLSTTKSQSFSKNGTILCPLLWSILAAEIQVVDQAASNDSESVGSTDFEDHSFHRRSDRSFVGQHLPFPDSISSHVLASLPICPWWHVGWDFRDPR